MCSRTGLTALWLGIMAALIAGPAGAADTGNGSKNFRAPPTVPNYFSNEAGPMLGPASETQRGPLVPSGASVPAVAPRPPTSYVSAPPQVRQHIAMADPHLRVIRGRRGEPVVPRHIAVRGRPTERGAVHGSSQRHVVQVASVRGRPTQHAVTHGGSERHIVRVAAGPHRIAAPSRTSGRATPASAAHHHGRG